MFFSRDIIPGNKLVENWWFTSHKHGENIHGKLIRMKCMENGIIDDVNEKGPLDTYGRVIQDELMEYIEKQSTIVDT